MERSCDVTADLSRLLYLGAEDNAWMCCCPQPYKPCPANRLSDNCVSALVEKLGPIATAETRPQRGALLDALQEARGALLSFGGDACDALAPEKPHATCDPVAVGTPWSSRRSDLLCELVSWKWEALGVKSEDQQALGRCPLPQGNKASKQGAKLRSRGQTLRSDVRAVLHATLGAQLEAQQSREIRLYIVLAVVVLTCISVQTSLLCGMRCRGLEKMRRKSKRDLTATSAEVETFGTGRTSLDAATPAASGSKSDA